ncbi:MAG TPA: FtsX-like permease family protein [Gemmatimonadales bacterium]|jgi:putative ABC transport system permease protein|nr:FtsX-like permease family protein [Gemmatimonadales bacterium]
MKFLPIVLANLGRHKIRTTLTILSVIAALFLFASLRSVLTTLHQNAQFGGAHRLITLNATGLVFTMPVSYGTKIRSVPGVRSVSWANWFGGKYGDNKSFFGQFGIDPESYFAMYPELVMPTDQKEAFLRERSAAVIGERLANDFGWKVGQDVTLQGTIFPGDWTFTVRGIYKPSDPAIGDNMMLFHWQYLDERVGRWGQAGWFIVEIDSTANAATVAKAIDDQFRNSSTATKTSTERAFQASFAGMLGNLSLLLGVIGTAVVFAILLVTANAMMMSANERAGEIAVLKTIGYSNRTLFGLVLAEAGLIAIVGSALGLGMAKLLYAKANFNGGGFLPGFHVTSATIAWGALLAIVLILGSGLVPALRAAGMPIVQALRKVE